MILVLRVLVEKDPGKRGDRICARARRVRNRHAEIFGHGRHGASGSRCHRFDVGVDELATLVLHGAVRDLVLERVHQLDVAERARRLRDEAGHAFVAFAADADRPVQRRVGADFLFPLSRDLRQIVGPHKRRPRTVRPVHDRDAARRQGDACVDLRERRIVPLGDLAEEDVGEDRPRELDLCAQSFDVIDGHDGAEDGGEVRNRPGRLREHVVRHRLVACAEENRALEQLADAAARSDGLIVDLHGRVQCVVFREPLRIDGIRECRPRAVDLHCSRWGGLRRRPHRSTAATAAGHGQGDCCEYCRQCFHRSSRQSEKSYQPTRSPVVQATPE